MADWIRSTDRLVALAARLRTPGEIALDTEADSLHHYPERLCLVQLAAGDEAFLVDPLPALSLDPLGVVFSDPSVLTVVHAGDNDLAVLKRRFGFTFARLFDTSIAARFLGVRELGLDAMLQRFLGVEPERSRQKDDWSVRPLTPDQEAYAVGDVTHLVALKAVLLDELRARGREAWVLEESAALAALVVPERPPDPDAYLKIRGARALPRPALAILRELFAMRQHLALTRDRPPFKILGDDALRELAARAPRDGVALLEVPGCPPRVVERYGGAILAAIERGVAVPETELPIPARAPRPPVVPAPVRRRADALRAWRTAAAARLDLDPGVLLPGRLIDLIAAVPRLDRQALEGIDGLRRWRVRDLGDELVAAVAPLAG